MSDIEKFEQLKKRINDLNVKKMASESESKRLSEELDNYKKEIKETYGVEINDFASAIETMKKEYESKMEELESLIQEAENKIGVNK